MRLGFAGVAAGSVVGLLLIGSLAALSTSSPGVAFGVRGSNLAAVSPAVAGPTYAVVLNESGLPTGTSWSVALGGTADGVVGEFPTAGGPVGSVYDPQNGRLYIALSASNSVGVFAPNGTPVGSIPVGQGPRFLALDPTTNTIFVTNRFSNSTSIIDTSTDAVVGTVPVGAYPVGIAFDPVNGYVYVADSGLVATQYSTPPPSSAGQVTVINAATYAVVTTLNVGYDTRALSYDPLNGLVYVANYGYGNLTEINTSTDAVVGSISLGPGIAPSAPTVDLPTGALFVSENQPTGVLAEINPSTGAIMATVYLGAWPAAPYYDAANGLVYISNEFSDNVSVVNATLFSVLGSFPAGGTYPAWITSIPSTDTVYVAVWDSNETLLVNGTSANGGVGVPVGTATGSNVTGASGGAISFAEPNGQYSYQARASGAYAATPPTGTVAVVGSGTSIRVTFVFGYPLNVSEAGLPNNVTWNVTLRPLVGSGVLGNLTTSPSPKGLLYDPQNGRLYVALSGSNSVGVFDAANGTHVGTIAVGSDPRYLALDPATHTIYVTNRQSDNVSVVNALDDGVVGSIGVGSYPVGIAFDPVNGQIYVADSGVNATASYTPPVTTPGQVTVINSVTNTVVTTLTVGNDTRALTYDSVNGLVYVANYGFGNLTVINTTTDAVVGQIYIGVGIAPSAPAVDTATGNLYISDNNNPGSVFVYDPVNASFLGQIPVGAYPAAPIYDAANGLVYVGNEFSAYVSVISTSNDTAVGAIPAGDYPAAIATDPTDARLFVANWFSNDTMIVNTSAPGGGAGVLGTASRYANVTHPGPNTIALRVLPGAYAFSVGAPPAYTPSPGSGFVVVNASGSGIFINFTPGPISSVVFSVQSGLARGVPWSVTLDGQTETTRASELSFVSPAGAYRYSISGPANTRVANLPIIGEAVLVGVPVLAPLDFVSAATHVVKFHERGLPLGASWCVTVGSEHCAATPTVTIGNLPAGTYGYAIVGRPGATITARLGTVALPLAGQLTVSTENMVIAVDFAYRFPVTFVESGLPTGSSWGFSVAGHHYTSTGTTIAVELTNGTHTVLVAPERGYRHTVHPTPVHVVGAPLNETITFAAVVAPAPAAPRGALEVLAMAGAADLRTARDR